MRRIYNTTTWRRFRAQQLRREPLCVMCLERGITKPGKDVDHILPLKEGGQPFDFANVRSLCHEDHSRVTRAAAAGKELITKGCTLDGRPLDPNHWWNKSEKLFTTADD